MLKVLERKAEMTHWSWFSSVMYSIDALDEFWKHICPLLLSPTFKPSHLHWLLGGPDWYELHYNISMPRLVPHVQSSALLSVVLISIAAREPGIRLTFCIKSVFVPVSAGRQRVWKISLLSIINMEVVCVCVCVRERERGRAECLTFAEGWSAGGGEGIKRPCHQAVRFHPLFLHWA